MGEILKSDKSDMSNMSLLSFLSLLSNMSLLTLSSIISLMSVMSFLSLSSLNCTSKFSNMAFTEHRKIFFWPLYNQKKCFLGLYGKMKFENFTYTGMTSQISS